MIGIRSTMVEIRPATLDDLDALMALNAHVQAWHAQNYPQIFRTETDPDGLRAAFTQWLTDPESHIALSRAGGRPTGYIFTTCRTRPESWHGRAITQFEIEHIVVAPEARGQGHGDALMRHALDRAPRADHVQITLTSWAANTDAHRFFARFGFTPQHIQFAQTGKES